MNEDQQLLASAYLDGALTDDERARAEADPEVMAAVERLREIRQALAVVETPAPARREAAIDAALGTFDAEVRPIAPPPIASLTRRRASSWLIGAAAAALVLIVAGGILAVRSQGDDDDAGGAAQTQVLLSEADEQPAAAGTAPDASTATRSAAEDEGGGGATTGAPATTAAGSAAPGTVATAGTEGAPEATSVGRVLLTSPDDLTRFAADATALRGNNVFADSSRSCDVGGRWLGPATYVVDGVDTPVEVYLARRAGEVRAVDPATCDVIATAPAP
jgi:hypothetical protein